MFGFFHFKVITNISMFSPIISLSSIFKFISLVHLTLLGTWYKMWIQFNFFLIYPTALKQFIDRFFFIAPLSCYFYLILNFLVYLYILLTVFFVLSFCLSINAPRPQYFIDWGCVSHYIIILAFPHFSYLSECF